jgi:hypothetical protein
MGAKLKKRAMFVMKCYKKHYIPNPSRGFFLRQQWLRLWSSWTISKLATCP